MLRDDDGRPFYTSRRLLTADARSDDILHEVKAGERIRQIAWRYYRDPGAWWVIADYAIQDGHRILFPDRDLTAGMVLRLPSVAQMTCSSADPASASSPVGPRPS